MNSRSQTILDYAIVTMIAGMILSTVSSQKIPSLLFYILIAASCFNWYVHYKRRTSTEGIELKQHKTLFILCSVSLVAVLVSKAVHLNMSGTEIEKAVRFSIGLPIFYAGLRFIPYERLKHSLWGVYAAIVFQFVYSAFIVEDLWGRPITDSIYNSVSYSVLVVLLTVITLFSFRIELIQMKRMEYLLKGLVIALGVSTFVLLRARTGVIALPMFIFIVVLVFLYKYSFFKKTLVLVLMSSIVLCSVFAIPQIQMRMKQAVQEYSSCVESDFKLNSSVCIRMQLSNAALVIWQNNLMFGTGDNSLFQELMETKLQFNGTVTNFTAENFGEPHNDYMQSLSSFGLLGLVGLFLLYLGPGLFFLLQTIREKELVYRCIAAMGAATCLSFPLFSLTELMFRNMRTISFYTTLVVLFLVLLDVCRQSKLTAK